MGIGHHAQILVIVFQNILILLENIGVFSSFLNRSTFMPYSTTCHFVDVFCIRFEI